jgi:hypothetical protein
MKDFPVVHRIDVASISQAALHHVSVSRQDSQMQQARAVVVFSSDRGTVIQQRPQHLTPSQHDRQLRGIFDSRRHIPFEQQRRQVLASMNDGIFKQRIPILNKWICSLMNQQLDNRDASLVRGQQDRGFSLSRKVGLCQNISDGIRRVQLHLLRDEKFHQLNLTGLHGQMQQSSRFVIRVMNVARISYQIINQFALPRFHCVEDWSSSRCSLESHVETLRHQEPDEIDPA